MRARNEELRGVKDAVKAGQGRKPYRSPRLVVYGDLRRLTMGKGGVQAEAPANTKQGA